MSENSYSERKCSRCGKVFIFHPEWVYRISPTDTTRIFCSWSCLQAFRNERGTKTDRRDKIIQAIKDGLSTNEICKLLNEQARTVWYWRKKLEGEKDDVVR